MKPHLPLSLLSAFVAVATLAHVHAATYTDAIYTAPAATTPSVAGASSLTSSDEAIAPNMTGGTVNLSNYAGSLTIQGGTTTESIADKTTASPNNGGYGGRVTFSGTASTSLSDIYLTNGTEVALNNVFGDSEAAYPVLHVDNASFYFTSTLGASLDVGAGGVRLNGNGGAVYTLTGAITGSGTIYSATGKNASGAGAQILTGDVSAFTGTWTEESNVTDPKYWQFGAGDACTNGVVGGQIGASGIKRTRAEFNYSGDYRVAGAVYAHNMNVLGGNATFAQAVDATNVSVTTAGSVTFEAEATIGTLTVSGHAVNAATLHFTSGSITTISGTAAGMEKSGEGALTVGNLGSNSVTMNGGSLTITNSGAYAITMNGGSLTATVGEGATIIAGTGGTLDNCTLSGGTIHFGDVLSGSSGLSYSGDFTLTSGDLSFSSIDPATLTDGTYTLFGGTGAGGDLTGLTINGAAVGADGSFTAGIGVLRYSGTLAWAADGSLVITDFARISRTLSWDGGATGTWSAEGAGWNEEGATGGTSNFSNGDAVIFNDVTAGITLDGVVDPASVIVSGNSDVTLLAGTNGALQGTGVLTLSDNAQLTIEMSNSYSGGTAIDGGTLNANAADALGTGAITLNGGSLHANAANATGTGAITVNGGTLYANAADALGSSGVALNGGALVLGHTQGLGTGSVTFNGGILRYGSGVTDDISAQLVAGTGPVHVDIADNHVSWASSVAGDVVLSGTTGSLTLNDTTNAGPGNLQIDGGSVILTSGASLKTNGSALIQTVVNMTGGSLLISGSGNGSQLYYSGTNTTKYTYLFGSAFELTPDAGKTITIGTSGDTNRGIGFFIAAADSIALRYDGSHGGGTATISADISAWGTSNPGTRTFDISKSAGTDVEVEITGTLGEAQKVDGRSITLVKTGTGTLKITGVNNTPALTISEGTVIANNGQALGVDRNISNVVTVGNQADKTAALDLQKSNTTGITQLLGNENGIITNTATEQTVLTIGKSAESGRMDSSFDGRITGNLSVEVVDGNKLTLRGTNDYTGSTAVGNGASLTLRESGSISNGTARVAAHTSGTAAVLSNVTSSATGIRRTVADGSQKGTVEHARIDVSLADAAASFDIENVGLIDSLVNLQTAGTVNLNNVTIGAGTSIANAGGATVNLKSSTVNLTSNSVTAGSASLSDGVLSITSGELAGYASISGSLTLNLTSDFIQSLLKDAGGAFNRIEMTFTGAEDVLDAFKANGGTLKLEGDLSNPLFNGTVTFGGNEAGTGGVIVIATNPPVNIPEPASSMLALAGLAALACRRRRPCA